MDLNHKKTVVLGASPNPARESFRVVTRLAQSNIDVVPIGLRNGEIEGVKIQNKTRVFEDVHTVTLYMNSKNQEPFYEYILDLKPKRIIFNPGAENEELRKLAQERGIEAINACTMTMLAIGTF